MKKHVISVSVAAALCALCAQDAEGVPVQWTIASGRNDHDYEVVALATPISWTDAKAAAELPAPNGVSGYLATTTSQEEQDFIMSIYVDPPGGHSAWLGGSDAAVEGTWEWVTPPTAEAWGYTNWRSGEPNDLGGEDHLAVHGNAHPDTGAWFDVDAGVTGVSGSAGYVVEYDSNPIPEPDTLALVGLGLLGVAR